MNRKGVTTINNNELVEQLNLFINNAFCYYSHYKANQIWIRINKYIPYPYSLKISTEWSHVLCSHGYKGACAALDYEVKEFIKTLKSNK